MKTRVTLRGGVHAKQRTVPNERDPGFFTQLSSDAGLKRFAPFEGSPRQSPTTGVPAANQHHSAGGRGGVDDESADGATQQVPSGFLDNAK